MQRMGDARNSSGKPERRYTVRSRFFTPPPQFDGCFTTFYRLVLDVEDGGVVTDFLQPEWANIRFFTGGCPDASIGDTRVRGARFAVTGPSSLPCRFELGTSRMWGIGFLPVGWARFFDAEAADCVNVVAEGQDHPAFRKFDELTKVLTDPDIEEEEQYSYLVAVLGRLMRPNRDEAKLARVHSAMVDGEAVTVHALADQCGMSIRTLERLCLRYFGFTPKLLMRRQRFMRSLTTFMLHQAQGGTTRWTEAMDAEYHDQAQFTREFRTFMSMLPSEYAALEHPILTSFMEARARVWGSAAQTLDGPRDRHPH